MNKQVLGWVLAVIVGAVLGAAALAAMVHFMPTNTATFPSMMMFGQSYRNNQGFPGYELQAGRPGMMNSGPRGFYPGQDNNQSVDRSNGRENDNPGGRGNRQDNNRRNDGRFSSNNCFGPSSNGRRGRNGWMPGPGGRMQNNGRNQNYAQPSPGGMMQNYGWNQNYAQPGPGGMMQNNGWNQNYAQPGPGAMMQNYGWNQNYAQPGPGAMMQNYGWNQNYAQPGPGGMMQNDGRNQNYAQPGPGGMMQNDGVNQNGGMMGWGWFSQNQNNSNPNQTRLTIDQAVEKAKTAVESFDKNTVVSNIMEFSNNFYVIAKEKESGKPAYELLVNVYTGLVTPEPGPNMMWNQKYGHMGSGTNVENTISMEQAVSTAQKYLDSNISGAKVEEKGSAFPGYYTFDYKINDKVAGMISIHGSNGTAWLHTWHGQFIQEKEIS